MIIYHHSEEEISKNSRTQLALDDRKGHIKNVIWKAQKILGKNVNGKYIYKVFKLGMFEKLMILKPIKCYRGKEE